MFYKRNSFSGGLRAADPFAAYQPQVLTELEQQTRLPVMASSPTIRSLSMANPASQVLKYQKLFQEGALPVYLRGGPRDKVIYNVAMGLSFVGIGVTLATIYGMASGKLKKSS